MSFLERIRECNRWDRAAFRPLLVAGQVVGALHHATARRVAEWPEVFQVDAGRVRLAPALASFEARTAAVARVVAALAEEGLVTGWRDERYPVKRGFADLPLFAVERAAVPCLGVRAFGVHLNGYVRRADGLHMWVARRAADKPTYPGMLDNMVAGGQPIGVGLKDNVVKECAEEAGIPAGIAARACPVGAISYCMETPEGLKPDVQFCWDLELPEGFEPLPRDGEVAAFELWPVARVAEVVAGSRAFKPNCNLVIIDFLVRHGLLDPGHPDYLDIVEGLRAGAEPFRG